MKTIWLYLLVLPALSVVTPEAWADADSLDALKQRLDIVSKEIGFTHVNKISEEREARARKNGKYDWSAIQPLIVPLEPEYRTFFEGAIVQLLDEETPDWHAIFRCMSKLSREAPDPAIEAICMKIFERADANLIAKYGYINGYILPLRWLASQGTETSRETLVEIMTLGALPQPKGIQAHLMQFLKPDDLEPCRAHAVGAVFGFANLDFAESVMKEARRRLPENSATVESIDECLGYLDRKREGVEHYTGAVP